MEPFLPTQGFPWEMREMSHSGADDCNCTQLHPTYHKTCKKTWKNMSFHWILKKKTTSVLHLSGSNHHFNLLTSSISSKNLQHLSPQKKIVRTSHLGTCELNSKTLPQYAERFGYPWITKRWHLQVYSHRIHGNIYLSCYGSVWDFPIDCRWIIYVLKKKYCRISTVNRHDWHDLGLLCITCLLHFKFWNLWCLSTNSIQILRNCPSFW